ncbi:MAG: glycogen synthase GlgA [Gemmatimonadaceae bacterium]|nr:glycogen synthase GlgA [Gemmatimonadaceae bacterium]
MRVLFVAAEVAPFVKTGGLADVAGALPAALAAQGHDVRVIMPRYRAMRVRGVPADGPVGATFLPVGERAEEMRLLSGTNGAVPVYFLDIPAAFERDAIYGERDDHRRFILFARGVLAAMQHLREVDGWQPDVVHGHDWHAALVINYLKTYYAYTFGHIATVFTIHNLAYQGQGHPDLLSLAGLTEGGLVENGLGPGIANSFNCMARGIRFADVVSTVSPTYAREIMTMEYGERLDGLLRHRHDRVAGILNGIDTALYDPAHDAHIAAPYSADDVSGKAACKTALQERCGLEVNATRPLLGVVSRLVEQKGFVLLEAALPWLIQETSAQLVLLGSGDAHLESVFQRAAQQYGDRVSVRVGFDVALAQQIYAGSDAFLMPSRFEPCGLGQMIALRYGSVPIVRATGGLADTVREGLNGNGFVFHPFDARHFRDAIARALACFADPADWLQVRERGMRADHSWTRSAAAYGDLYDWARSFVRR